jgi:type VI secretion system protein
MMATMKKTLLKYEPRLATIGIELLEQVQPGHLEFGLQAQLKSGQRVNFGTTVAAEGKVLVRHLKRQQWLS